MANVMDLFPWRRRSRTGEVAKLVICLYLALLLSVGFVISIVIKLNLTLFRWHAETNIVICSLCQRLNVFQSRLLRCPLHHPKTIKLNGMQRQIWSSAPFVAMSFDRDCCGLPFVIQRQSSPMARTDNYGHLLPLSMTQCLSTETFGVSPSSSRDNQV